MKRALLRTALAAALATTAATAPVQATAAAVPGSDRIAAARAGAEAMQVRLARLRTASATEAAEVLADVASIEISPAKPAAAAVPAWIVTAPDALRRPLTNLWHAVQSARADVARALPPLTARDIWLVRSAFSISGALAVNDSSPEVRAAAEELTALARLIDVGQLAAAALRLVDAGTAWTAPPTSRATTGACASGDVVFEAPGCVVVIGGTGSTTYTANAIVTIDHGGSDVYENNAGGVLAPGGVALAYDEGTDNDRYEATDLGSAQAAAVGGAGVLIDDGGDDVYRYVDTEGKPALAQAGSFAGAGILWDRGEGNDSYSSRNFAQGVASVGFSLLLDGGGADSYTVPKNFDSEGSQGTACGAGVGALVDQGDGHDAYVAAIDDMQGMACLGATGLLWDGGGHDEFVLQAGEGELSGKRVVQSGWGQGYAELGATGILVNEGAGSDRYDVEVLPGEPNTGTLVHGMGLAGGTGYLIDGGGNDTYAAGRDGQGVGLLASTGVLLDRGGDDDYKLTTSGQGFASLGGVGLLADLDGTDRYAAESDCQGFNSVAGLGALIDFGGDTDTYNCNAGTAYRANDAVWLNRSLGLGVGIDR